MRGDVNGNLSESVPVRDDLNNCPSLESAPFLCNQTRRWSAGWSGGGRLAPSRRVAAVAALSPRWPSAVARQPAPAVIGLYGRLSGGRGGRMLCVVGD